MERRLINSKYILWRKQEKTFICS